MGAEFGYGSLGKAQPFPFPLTMTLLEELFRAIELWLRIAKEQVPLVDPTLDPVLLVPGIAGSILEAVDEEGNKERVWVRILAAEHEFREKLWSKFDASTGTSNALVHKLLIIWFIFSISVVYYSNV